MAELPELDVACILYHQCSRPWKHGWRRRYSDPFHCQFETQRHADCVVPVRFVLSEG